MRSVKLGLVAAMMCAMSATAEAGDCARITALGQNVTHDLAVLFANNALKNVLASKGLVGKGPVKMTCDTPDGTTCHASQTACKGATPKSCIGAWLCF